MRAYICDKCGKAVLLEDNTSPYECANGIYHLVSNFKGEYELDLCEDCVKELMSAIREMKGGDSDAAD